MHAARDVEQQDQVQGLLAGRELHDRLGLAFVEDAEILFGESGEDAAVFDNFGIGMDEGDFGAEGGSGLRRGDRGECQREVKRPSPRVPHLPLDAGDAGLVYMLGGRCAENRKAGRDRGPPRRLYSPRNVCAGSIRTARKAGGSAASTAAHSRITSGDPSMSGSVALTSYNRLSSSRWQTNPPAIPAAAPSITSHNKRLVTRRTTCPA